MKKWFFILGLLGTLSLWAQTNGTGTSCDNAVFLDHSQNISTYTGSGESEMWFEFVADTSFMKFVIDNSPNIELFLFGGDCNNLDTLEYGYGVITSEVLSAGVSYIIHTINPNNLVVQYSILSNYVNEDFTCSPLSDCNKIANGNFLQNAWNFGPESSPNANYNYTFYPSAFAQNITGVFHSHVTGWHALWGTPDLIKETPTDPVICLMSRQYYSGGFLNEAAVTCTELLQGDIYVLSYKSRAYSPVNDLKLHIKLTTQLIDDEIDNYTWHCPSLTNLPNNIENIPFDEIVNVSVQNTAYVENTTFINPTQDYNRMYMYATSLANGSTPTGKIFVDDIQIIPVHYDPVTTCLPNITLHPTCEADLNSLTGVTYAWSPTTAVVGNPNTLTPVINTTSSPLMTLTITQGTETFTTQVQVTYQPMQLTTDVTHVACGETCTGAIDINVIGGTPNYTFNWICAGNGYANPLINQPATGGDINQLCPGTYEVTVTSSEGCIAQKPKIDVLQATLVAEANSVNTYPSQNCGAVIGHIVSAVGTSGNYTWVWHNNAGQVVGNTAEVWGLGSGVYFYTVTDTETGCSYSGQTTISSSNISFPIDETVYICEPGATTLTTPTIYTSYIWNTGATTSNIAVNLPGEYTVNMFNDYGCRLQKTFYVKPYDHYFDLDYKNCENLTTPGISGNVPNSYYIYSDVNMQSFNITIKNYDVNGNVIGTQVPYFGVSNEFDYLATTVSTPGSYPYDDYTVVYVSGNHPVTGCPVYEEFYLYETNFFEIGEPLPPLTGTWNNVHYIFEDNITLTTGSLTIKNSTIEFFPNKGFIVINPNTKLIVDNSDLKEFNCTEALWNGISSTGVASNPLNGSYQPTVTIQNNSTITGANYAIYATKGAMVKVNNSSFINNNYGVNIFDYQLITGNVLPSYPSISNNYFETNADGANLSGFNFIDFIHIDYFPSVFAIDHNTFTNIDYSKPYNQRGNGVYLRKIVSLSKFRQNHFNRLTLAVNVGRMTTLFVEANYLQNNYNGIKLSSITTLKARSNVFDDELLMPQQNAFQMSVGTCAAPRIAHNQFNNGVVGLLLESLNTGSFQVKNNSFAGFDIYSNATLNGHPTAILNQGINGTFGATPTGAEIKCNTFTDYDYAIAISTGLIKGTQGSTTGPIPTQAPIGNRFFTDANLPDGKFFVSTATTPGLYIYNRHQDAFCALTPQYTAATIMDVNTNQPYIDNSATGSCPDETDLIATWYGLNALTAQLKTEIETKTEALDAKVDAGNTELLRTDIMLSSDAAYTALVQDLQTLDSYISDEAAVDFIEKPTSRPVAKAVALVANSPLPEKAKQKLADSDLPDNLKSVVNSYQNGLSKREKDELDIAAAKQKQYETRQDLLLMALQDTTGVRWQELSDQLSGEKDPDLRWLGYSMLQSNADAAELRTYLLQMKQDWSNFTDTVYAEHLNDIDAMLYEVQLSEMPDSLRLQSIQSLSDQWVDQAKGTHKRAALAMEHLKELGLWQDETLQLPNPEQQNRHAVASNAKSSNIKPLGDMVFLELYPNPVKDRLTIEYIVSGKASVNTIYIFDIQGRLVQSQSVPEQMGVVEINVQNLSQGSYILSFDKNQAGGLSKKFVVE